MDIIELNQNEIFAVSGSGAIRGAINILGELAVVWIFAGRPRQYNDFVSKRSLRAIGLLAGFMVGNFIGSFTGGVMDKMKNGG